MLINDVTKLIGQVSDYVYLGSHISLYNYQKTVKENLVKCNRLSEIYAEILESIGRKCRLSFIRIIEALLYGCEC